MSKLDIGVTMKELRNAKRLKLSVVAERVGVTVGAISSYENGMRYPSYDVLIKIAHLYNVTTDYLLGNTQKDIIEVTGLKSEQRDIIYSIIKDFKEHNDLDSYIKNQQAKLAGCHSNILEQPYFDDENIE